MVFKFPQKSLRNYTLGSTVGTFCWCNLDSKCVWPFIQRPHMPTPAAFRSPVACSHNPLHQAGSLYLLFWCPDWNDSYKRCFKHFKYYSQTGAKLKLCVCVCAACKQQTIHPALRSHITTWLPMPARSLKREKKHVTNICCWSSGACRPHTDLWSEFLHVFSLSCGLRCLLSSSFWWFNAVCCLLKVLKYVLLPVRVLTVLFSVQTGRSVRRRVTVFRDLSSVQIMMKWVFNVGAAILQYPEPANVWSTYQSLHLPYCITVTSAGERICESDWEGMLCCFFFC